METILVIDDERLIRRMCEDILTPQGYRVLEAPDAPEGLVRLQEGDIDLILLDIMMPKMSGIEALPRIKAADPDVAVIVVTAHASVDSAIRAIQCGAADYIRKPFKPHEISHTVRQVLERRRLAIENKRLLHDLQTRVGELATLNRVGQYLHSALDIDKVLENIIHSIATVMGGEIAWVMLCDPEAGVLTIRASTGLSEAIVREIREPVGQGIAGGVAQRGEPLLINDIRQDPRVQQLTRGLPFESGSLLVVPLTSTRGVLGVISVHRKSGEGGFNDADRDLLMTFAAQAAAAIENASLYQQVQRFNLELEEKVRQATSELSRANQDLEARVAELSTLYESSRVMSATLNPTDLLRGVLGEVAQVIPYDVAQISMGAGELRLFAQRVRGCWETLNQPIPSDESTSTGWLATNRQHRLVPVVGPGDATGITPSSRECWGGMPVGSYVGIPLLQGERLVGTVELGAVSPGTFTDRHLAILLTLSGQMAAALENAQLYSEIKRNLVETLRSLSAVLDARDEYTRNHSARVTKVALRVAREMKLSEETLNNLRLAGPLHDIGKIGVPDEILKSASKLTPEQRKIMEAHPAIGARILEHLKFLRGITDIVLQHQERYDGSGYPAGLTGEAIRIEARILAVADTYDAMMSRRRYRNAVFSHDDIVAEMRKYQGIQFDPGIVEAFARIPETDLQVIYESDAEALREEIPSALLDLH